MSEILIRIEIDNNNDICISNENTGASFTISYENKYISASSIYDVLSYKTGDVYVFKEVGIEEKTEEKVKQYFKEIVNMFDKIRDEISSLTIKDPDDDISEIDYSDDESNAADLPF